MASIGALVTADELLAMHEGRRELIRGEVIEMDWSGAEHGAISANVGGELRAHVRANQLGQTYGAETGFRIATNPDTVRAPDASFVKAERVQRTDRYFPGAPDFAVEVISPSDTFTEVEEKAFQWLDAGASGVLVLDPRRRTATVYRSRDDVRNITGEVELDLSDIVPGWRPALAVLFE